MKKFAGVFAAVMLFAMLTGCSSGDKHQDVSINLEGNQPLSETTEETATTAAKVETKATVVSNKEPTITKANRIENVPGRATFVYQGRSWEGKLLLTESAFFFTPDQGEEIRIPLNIILLVSVKYESDATYETIMMYTENDEFEFRAEIGYADKISDYIIITETAGEY